MAVPTTGFVVEAAWGVDALASPTLSWQTIDNVEAVSISRGRGSWRDRMAPGTITVTFRDPARKYDPIYSSGSLYGNLRLRTRIRVRHTTYGTIATGWIRRGPVAQWAGGARESLVTIQAVEVLGIVAGYLGPRVSTVQTAGTHITLALSEIGYTGAGALSDIDDGTVLVRSGTGDVEALTWMQTVAESDRGVLFSARSGHVTFRQGDWFYGLTSAATFTDDATVANVGFYSEPTFEYSDADLVNVAAVGVSSDGLTGSDSDTTSITDYGAAIYQRSDLLMASITDCQSTAEQYVAAFSQPAYRPTSITLRPPSDTEATFVELMTAIGSNDVPWRCTVAWLPPGGGGRASDDFFVESEQWDINGPAGTLTVRLGLGPRWTIWLGSLEATADSSALADSTSMAVP